LIKTKKTRTEEEEEEEEKKKKSLPCVARLARKQKRTAIQVPGKGR